MDENFEPYKTDGYWVMSDYRWTWSSDYEWGWAPFHYGRWDFDNYYGNHYDAYGTWQKIQACAYHFILHYKHCYISGMECPFRHCSKRDAT